MDSSYPVGFRFEVTFVELSTTPIGFKEISGITMELQTEDVTSGGENDFKYRLPTTATSTNLVLKRALVPDNSMLLDWWDDTMGFAYTSIIKVSEVIVDLLDENGDVQVSWAFERAYPVKLSMADLNSEESKVFIETLELTYMTYNMTEHY
jgi:phage tail-like protein